MPGERHGDLMALFECSWYFDPALRGTHYRSMERTGIILWCTIITHRRKAPSNTENWYLPWVFTPLEIMPHCSAARLGFIIISAGFYDPLEFLTGFTDTHTDTNTFIFYPNGSHNPVPTPKRSSHTKRSGLPS